VERRVAVAREGALHPWRRQRISANAVTARVRISASTKGVGGPAGEHYFFLPPQMDLKTTAMSRSTTQNRHKPRPHGAADLEFVLNLNEQVHHVRIIRWGNPVWPANVSSRAAGDGRSRLQLPRFLFSTRNTRMQTRTRSPLAARPAEPYHFWWPRRGLSRPILPRPRNAPATPAW